MRRQAPLIFFVIPSGLQPREGPAFFGTFSKAFLSTEAFLAYRKHLAHHLFDVVRCGAMVNNAGPQHKTAMNRRVRQEYLSSAIHVLQDLLVLMTSPS